MPVQIGAPTISGGASTRTAEAISRWAAEKQHQQAQKNLRLAREEGEQVEILEDATGKKIMPEQKPVGFFGGKTAEQYNKGVRDAYLLAVDTDNTTEVNRIAQESDGNLDQYEKVIGQYRNTVLANVDPVASADVARSLDSMIARGRNQVQRLGIDRQIKQDKESRRLAAQSYFDEASRLTRNGELEGAQENLLKSWAALESMVDSGDISSDVAKEEFRRGKLEVFEQGYRKDLLDIADANIDKAFNQLDKMSKDVPKDWTPDEWDGFIASAQTALNRKVNRMLRDEKQKAIELKRQADFEAVEKRYKEDDDTQIIEPKVLDSYYSEILSPQLDQIENPELRRAEQAHFIDRMKAIPKSLQAEIENGIFSGSPELMEQSALLIDRIDKIEGVVNDIPHADQAYIKTVVNLLPNMAPAEAMQTARQATDPKDKARIEAVELQIKEQFKKKNKIDEYTQKAEAAFKTFIFGPDVDDVSGYQMGKEYGDLYESFRKAGMAENDAFEKADNMIKRNWGETSVMGDSRIMKYPPEMYYSVNGDITWVMDQLLEEVNDPKGGAFFGKTIKRDDLFLMSNDATERTASMGRPTYSVKALIDGSFYNLGDFQPDMDAETQRIKEMNVKEGLEYRKSKLQRALKSRSNASRRSLNAVR